MGGRAVRPGVHPEHKQARAAARRELRVKALRAAAGIAASKAHFAFLQMYIGVDPLAAHRLLPLSRSCPWYTASTTVRALPRSSLIADGRVYGRGPAVHGIRKPPHARNTPTRQPLWWANVYAFVKLILILVTIFERCTVAPEAACASGKGPRRTPRTRRIRPRSARETNRKETNRESRVRAAFTQSPNTHAVQARVARESRVSPYARTPEHPVLRAALGMSAFL